MAYQKNASRSNPADIPEKARRKTGKKKHPKKKGNRTITLIFYTCYFVLVAAMLAGLWFLQGWLSKSLTSFEASQPDTRCQEIFREHFAQPDWAELYRMAGIPDTTYEGSDAYARYMAAKAGPQELTYVQAATALPGERKYLLKLGSETIGFFTLVDRAPRGADIAHWQLGEISLNCSYNRSVSIQTPGSVTVFVNGVALTDDHVTRVSTTLAEDYLPAGVKGPRTYTHYLAGLMAEPQITAADEEGNALEVIYDEAQDLYIVRCEGDPIPQELYDRVLNTAKAYALMMIRKASQWELAKYFDTASSSYQAILRADSPAPQRYIRSYVWGEERITGYFRHSDSLFSVHVELPMFVTQNDNTVEECKVDHSFIFQLQNNTWKCIHMTNVDIREQDTSVRLTFQSGDHVVFTNFFDQNGSEILIPLVTAPEGKVFDGWYRKDVSADGIISYTLVFMPNENGLITIPSGTKLEPMILYALFADTK